MKQSKQQQGVPARRDGSCGGMGNPESLLRPWGRERVERGLRSCARPSASPLPLGRVSSRELHGQIGVVTRRFQLWRGKRMAGGSPRPCKGPDLGPG